MSMSIIEQKHQYEINKTEVYLQYCHAIREPNKTFLDDEFVYNESRVLQVSTKNKLKVFYIEMYIDLLLEIDDMFQ